MTAFFLACAALGGGILVLQLVLSLVGVGHDGGADVHDVHAVGGSGGGDHALDLLSVRALAAGVAFFGVGGLIVLSAHVTPWLALPVAVVLGLGAALAVAAAMRAMLRLEDDGAVRIEGAVGVSGSVYLRIPGGRAGVGKVHLAVQGRLVEYQAITANPDALPTGARIMVVNVVDSETVDVVPDPLLLSTEVPNAVR